jgi:hypothetical protein
MRFVLFLIRVLSFGTASFARLVRFGKMSIPDFYCTSEPGTFEQFDKFGNQSYGFGYLDQFPESLKWFVITVGSSA